VKRALGSAYLLLKGAEKVTGELSLTFMAYNFKRAISMLGVGRLEKPANYAVKTPVFAV
jgi:transposase